MLPLLYSYRKIPVEILLCIDTRISVSKTLSRDLFRKEARSPGKWMLLHGWRRTAANCKGSCAFMGLLRGRSYPERRFSCRNSTDFEPLELEQAQNG